MSEQLMQACACLARELSETTSVTETAEQVVAFAIEALGTPFAGITMIRSRGRFQTVGPSAPSVVAADDQQYDLREGPCLEASTTVPTVMASDLRSDARWPRWSPAAVDLGFRSIVAAELHAGGDRIGSLHLYGDRVRQFSDQDVEVAHLFARHAAAALAAVRLREGLLDALESRTVIGQAQGIVMERFDVDDERAFAILRRYSQDGNVRVSEIARRLVASRALPTSDGADRRLETRR